MHLRGSTIVAMSAALVASAMPSIASSLCCPADIDGDGMVGAADLGALLANWGGSGAGDLDESGVVDPADLAALLAAWGKCALDCKGADEGEPCGSHANNGGCAQQQLGTMARGETICGTSWADNGYRDLDWFLLDLSANQGDEQITATLLADFSSPVLFITTNIQTDCPPRILGQGAVDGCSATVTMSLAPGFYDIVVTQNVFDGYPCDGGAVNYAVTVQGQVGAGRIPDR